MTELEAFEWWKTEQDEAGYKQSEIAALAWQAACKWQRENAAVAILGVDIAPGGDCTVKGFYDPRTGEYHIQEVVHNDQK